MEQETKALTIEEFKALLEFAFKGGRISGKYENSSAGYRQDLGVKGFHVYFEDWYKENIYNKKLPQEKPERKNKEERIRYRGKGEHTLNELEKIIQQLSEHIHNLNSRPSLPIPSQEEIK